MRWFWMTMAVGLAGCGGGAGACPTGVELGEEDAGCDCAGEDFVVYDNGEVCTCEEEGLVCDGALTDTAEGTTTSTTGCRSVDCT